MRGRRKNKRLTKWNRIIKNNSYLFDFIGNEDNKISINDYLLHLTPIHSICPHRITCGTFDEDYISS